MTIDPNKVKTYKLDLKGGQFMIPVFITEKRGRLWLNFPFNRPLLNEVKVMEGARWHGYDANPVKQWSIKDCHRNRFQLAVLAGRNPYAHYDKPLLDVKPNRNGLYEHQDEMFRFGLTRRQCLFACEMGTGKTLAAIEVMEHSDYHNWVWVGPRSALAAVKLEFEKWDAKIEPRFMTYDRLKKHIKEGDFLLPDGIVFDECTKIKTPTTQRSQAAAICVEEMRRVNPACFILEMSGAPAPKAPDDWWHQCEIACPGFLREGNRKKFKERLCLIVEKQSVQGGVYPEIVTWWDDHKKCKTCGKYAHEHNDGLTGNGNECALFVKSTNEVEKLYRRMEGLVIVKFKSKCVDLPERQSRVIRLDVEDSMRRAAGLIVSNSARAIEALTLLRELSDGFQYTKREEGTDECPRCHGSVTTTEWYDPEYPDEAVSPEALESGRCLERTVTCPHCKEGRVPHIIRDVVEVPTPKEQLLIDLLDEHESIGRFVVYAGFQASIDRCVTISRRYGWDVIRVDGRGWTYLTDNPDDARLSDKDMLRRFQAGDGPKTVFIGQPGSAGMGLTLTASPSTFFYSNSFNGEDRLQAVDRIHRIGMDTNRGATIIDVIHLPIDEYVLANLTKKDKLQKLSMGELQDAYKAAEEQFAGGSYTRFE